MFWTEKRRAHHLLLSLILCFILLFTQVSFTGISFAQDQLNDIYEPNNSQQEAIPIPFNEIISSKIMPESDVDYYKINRISGITTFELVVPPNMDGVINIYSYGGHSLIDNGGLGEKEIFEIANVYGTGIFYISISDKNGKAINEEYSLKVTMDSDGPIVRNTIPANSSSDISLNQNISIEFDKKIFVYSLKSITLKDSFNNVVPIDKLISGNILNIRPKSDLIHNSNYTLTIPKFSFQDKSGLFLKNDYILTFSTTKDSQPPTILNTEPSNQNLNASPGKNIALHFSEDILAGGTYQAIILRGNDGSSIPIEKIIRGKSLIIDPKSNLANDSQYFLEIPIGAVKDNAGNYLISSYLLEFKTKAKEYTLNSSFVKLPFEVIDSEIDPDNPIVYLLSNDNKLYSVNYASGEFNSVSFESNPKSLEMGLNGEIFVTLPQQSKIFVIDKESFGIKEMLDITVDYPFNLIAGWDGLIYYTNANRIYSFDRYLKKVVDDSSFSSGSYIRFHPNLQRIYKQSATEHRAYQLLDGVFIGHEVPNSQSTPWWDYYSSPSLPEYLSSYFQIDPTGRYIFNGKGYILGISMTKEEDMNFVAKLSNPFSSIAFEEYLTKFYTLPLFAKSLYKYMGEDFSLLSKYPLLEPGKYLYKKDTEIIVIEEPTIKTDGFRSGIQIFTLDPEVPNLAVSLQDKLVTNKDSVEIFGKTEVGSAVNINGTEITADHQGNFHYIYSLSEGTNNIRIVATDVEGDYIEEIRTVYYNSFTPPQAPIGFVANIITSSQIDLSWNAVTGATSYKVYRSTDQMGTYSYVGTTNTNSYSDSGLSAETTYWYRLTAVNSDGEGEQSEAVSGKTLVALPRVPEELTVTGKSTSQIDLSWIALTGATSYKVYRATSQTGTYEYIGISNTNTYSNTDLSADTTYWYKVSAVNTGGEGAQSTPVSGKTLVTPPSAPTNLKAVSNSYNSVKLSWTVSSAVSGYEIYRSTSSTGYFTKIVTTSNTSYINTSLNTGMTYYYKIRAYKIGTSTTYGSFSSIISVKPIPATPTSIRAASSSYNTIKTSWAAVTGASGYQVYRATSSTGTYSVVGSTTSTSFNNTGLTTNKTYYYKIRAYRTVGTTKVYSNYSAIVNAKPVPSVPTNFKASRLSSTSIKLTWNSVSGVSGYQIYRSTSSSGTYSLLKSTTSLYYINSGLTTGKTYYFKLRAYRTIGTTKVYSGWTAIISARP